MVVSEKDAKKRAEEDAKKKSIDDDSTTVKKNDSTNGKPKLEQELSEEDAALKENLELMVMRASDPKTGVAKLALETMRREIRTATSSMTSVPKPLKFLRPHLQTLKDVYEKMKDKENKFLLADIVSLLAMTNANVSGEVPESL
ncbi:26S proteasome regulatory complex, non-ATPase subcomplex, Rpn1 subunit, partial [Ostreococcus tauri]